MNTYSKEELEEAQKALLSLIHKCEKAQATLRQGTPQWTTLCQRMKAFSLASQIVFDKLEEIQKGKV